MFKRKLTVILAILLVATLAAIPLSAQLNQDGDCYECSTLLGNSYCSVVYSLNYGYEICQIVLGTCNVGIWCGAG